MPDDSSKLKNDIARWARKEGAVRRGQYEDLLRRKKVLGPGETLVDRPAIARLVYLNWQYGPEVACQFARAIACRPHRYDVGVATLGGHITEPSAGQAAMALNEKLEVMKGQEEGAAILLPGLVDGAALSALCKTLGQLDGWNLKARLNPSDRMNRVYVRLTTEVAAGVEAEVLGVGPFDFLPRTRRAPVAAFHVRTKPTDAKPRDPKDSLKAHLADMSWPGGRESRQFGKLWKATEKARDAILGGDDSAARARITFAIPREIWDSAEPQTPQS